MWRDIVNENDLKDFMERIHFFHDSCIKELKYVSGAYVNDDLSMYPLNDKRILDVIIQCQYDDLSMIEMRFIGLKCLKLFPIAEDYTCEILDSTMFLKDGSVYWCDCGDLSEKDFDNYEGIFICASKLRWRPIENQMGQEDFYLSIK